MAPTLAKQCEEIARSPPSAVTHDRARGSPGCDGAPFISGSFGSEISPPSSRRAHVSNQASRPAVCPDRGPRAPRRLICRWAPLLMRPTWRPARPRRRVPGSTSLPSPDSRTPAPIRPSGRSAAGGSEVHHLKPSDPLTPQESSPGISAFLPPAADAGGFSKEVSMRKRLLFLAGVLLLALTLEGSQASAAAGCPHLAPCYVSSQCGWGTCIGQRCACIEP